MPFNMGNTQFMGMLDSDPNISKNPSFDAYVGPGLSSLMNRSDITEMYVNDDGFVWYESSKEGKVKSDIFLSPVVTRGIIEMVAGDSGKVANDDICSVSTEIRGYGYRFQGELPPIVRNPQFNIRKKAEQIFTLDDYVRTGTMKPEYKVLLEKSIADRKNILVVGGTASGKTTFLNAILDAVAKISPTHRVISLEDLPELQCSAKDYSPMFTKQDVGQSGVKFDMTRLLMDCMRRAPDRIVVGEVRDGCAYTMLKAWNTGHPGGACTVHADTAHSGLLRIESLALEDPNCPKNVSVLRMLIGEAVDVIVNIMNVRYKDGTKGRVVNEILCLDGYDSLKDKYLFTGI